MSTLKGAGPTTAVHHHASPGRERNEAAESPAAVRESNTPSLLPVPAASLTPAEAEVAADDEIEGDEPDRESGAFWRGALEKYRRPDPWKSAGQILTSVPPYFLLCYLMVLSLEWSYALTLLLAVPTAGFLIRIFIIQHDCGHHAFFRSLWLNDTVGFFCGLLTMTPYAAWRRSHARHHVTSGNLNHRGHGDIATLTVTEYLQRTPWNRFKYRVYRNPFFMFGFGATALFLVANRLTLGIPRGWHRERRAIHLTNAFWFALLALAWWYGGLLALIKVQLPVVMIGASVGTWLFFVQHQFEDAYWQAHRDWDATDAALAGSSYLKLPAVLQWFTGNIGFHHIHHLSSRIPNYHLAACYAEQPQLRNCVTLTIKDALACMALKLWDADAQRLISFRELRSRR